MLSLRAMLLLILMAHRLPVMSFKLPSEPHKACRPACVLPVGFLATMTVQPRPASLTQMLRCIGLLPTRAGIRMFLLYTSALLLPFAAQCLQRSVESVAFAAICG